MSRPKIRIGLAEDQTMFRHGLKQLLGELDEIEVVFDAENGHEFVRLATIHPIDIAFLDYKMPIMDGPKTARKLVKDFPEVKILFLSMFDDEEFIINAVENGANGYITKDQDLEEIQKAVHSIMNKGYYVNEGTSKLLIGNLMNYGKLSGNITKSKDSLTELELHVINLICQEYSTKEIAEKIFRGVRTVEGIRSNILKKTGAKNSNGIVMYAVKNGIVEV